VFSGSSVLSAIGLDGNPKLPTGEVHDVRRHRMLAAKMPADSMATQGGPQSLLGISGSVAQRAGGFD
jgi:hypothetical protein